MLYRELGKTKEKVSILGFGAMRLPTNGTNDIINKEKSSEILSYGIENGINIIDTAYSYHSADLNNGGNSEVFLGEFLKNSYRDDVLLSTKSPTWLIEKKEDFNKYLDEQLKRLQTDQIDIYLLHALTENNWDNLKALDVFEFMDSALESGKIKHIGFSAHAPIDYLIDFVEDYGKFEVGLTQMNFIDEQYQSGIYGLDYLESVNLGSMIMEPLRGGRLVKNVPQDVLDIYNQSEVKRNPVEWALQYLWNMKTVDCVLSGMNSLEQVKENIEIASRSEINCFNEEDKEIIREAAIEYRRRKSNDCNTCGYCMPCPQGVDIPSCLKEYNIAKMLDDPKGSAMQYFSLIEDGARADSCTYCEECKFICTQLVNIPEELEKANEFFGEQFNHF